MSRGREARSQVLTIMTSCHNLGTPKPSPYLDAIIIIADWQPKVDTRQNPHRSVQSHKSPLTLMMCGFARAGLASFRQGPRYTGVLLLQRASRNDTMREAVDLLVWPWIGQLCTLQTISWK